MKSLIPVRKAVLICAAVLLGFTFTSWQEGTTNASKNYRDTVPVKREKKIRDLDEALAELDGANDELQKTMREIDWKKINADLKESLKDLDIDLKKLNVELKNSLKEIDVDKMRQEVEASVAKIDWDEMKRELEKVKKIDLEEVKAEMEKVKVELKDLKPELEKNMKEARESIEKAKTELRSYKSFVDGLERDGLINKKEGYKIEHQGGQLFINGKPQSGEVYNKHRVFLEKNKKFTLEQSEDDFKIDND